MTAYVPERKASTAKAADGNMEEEDFAWYVLKHSDAPFRTFDIVNACPLRYFTCK
jgi:hypothetical protein